MTHLYDTIEKIVTQAGLSLYDIELQTHGGRNIFRIILKGKDGVSLDHCEEIARIVSPILDTNPPFSTAYSLEVSSPGIERPLKTERHYQLSVGELVKVTTKDGQKIQGKLLDVDSEGIVVEGHDAKIPFAMISKARTYFEW
ncbi:MAG: ribosome maturation factor RimP [Campylobacterales bacterium]